MALSLLYALLDIDDLETLQTLATKYKPTDDDKRALKYKDSTRKQQKEVQKALYEALYAIVEGRDVNKKLNMAIGKALCNAITGNRQGNLQMDSDIQKLYAVLKPIVTEAIDEI